MDKKTVDTLHMMICGELEEIAKKGTLSHETLDILKDLLQSEKDLTKIEKYGMEMEDMGYSQRKYYIDADYDPRAGVNSYRNGNSYGMSRNSYRGGNSYGNGNGNSYMYYDPRYDYPMYSMNDGYSRHGSSKEEMVLELKEMMKQANDESIRKAIAEVITKIDK